MVFTPPPSPLPPRHFIPGGQEDENERIRKDTFASLAAPKLLKSPHSRRALVILVPLLMILITSSSEMISYLRPTPVVYSGNFRDAPSPYVSSSLDVPLSLTQRLTMRRHRAAASSEPRQMLGETSDVGSRDSLDARDPEPPLEEELEEHASPTRSFAENGVRFGGSTTAPPVDPNAPIPTPFPQPWDSSLSYNFSSTSCLSFFTAQLANITFRQCRSFGLLLGYSEDFFNIETNLTLLTATLYGTCNTVPSPEECVQVENWMSANMDDPAVCAKDKDNENSIVLEAKGGFDQYLMMREVGCLVNNQTNAYCFAEAVANSSPSDAYYYNIPLGLPLPPTTVPSCNTCTREVMKIYARYAENSMYDVSKTYSSAANFSNTKCGRGYVPQVDTPLMTHKSGTNRRANGTGGLWIAFFVSFHVFAGSSILSIFS